jgi:hypothetical protein
MFFGRLGDGVDNNERIRYNRDQQRSRNIHPVAVSKLCQNSFCSEAWSFA